jgi:hypothetical protein
VSALDDILDEVEGQSGGGGGGADFWSPKKSGAGKHRIRLYRFADGELVRIRRKHYPEQGAKPVPCDFPEECKYCKTSEALMSVNDRTSQKAGKDMRQQIEMGFIGILIDKPDNWKLWGATLAQGRNTLVQVAKAVGWAGAYPNKRKAASEEVFVTEMQQFKAAMAEGLDKVCGPNGMDICITYNPAADYKDMYVVDLIFGEGKELPFPEDDEVPDPQVIWDRIEASRS